MLWRCDRCAVESRQGIQSEGMDASKDKLVRNIAIAATALTAALLITTDYGPHPHAFSSVSKYMDAAKEWFWTPSKKEREELQRRAASKQSGSTDES